jgi:DNA-binding transcriptional regulator GbsR (MarR family)
MQYVSNRGSQNLRHRQAAADLSNVFYPSDVSSIGKHLQADDSDDEISEMKSMVAVLRQECEELKKRQKKSRMEPRKTALGSEKTKQRETPSPDS